MLYVSASQTFQCHGPAGISQTADGPVPNLLLIYFFEHLSSSNIYIKIDLNACLAMSMTILPFKCESNNCFCYEF